MSKPSILSLEELGHPHEALLQKYRAELKSGVVSRLPISPARPGYLSLIESVVRFFKPQQDARGAIIDPVFEREWHYSTPCYALGAALLASTGKSEYLASATQAMLHACQMLADGQTPDDHPDFFTIFLIKADGLLRSLAAPADRERWQADLRRIKPDQTYRFQLGRVSEDHIHNWNAINLSGEFLRYQAGLGGNPGSQSEPSWWDRYLPYHLRRFIPAGLYRDGALNTTSHPLAYDTVTRYHLSAMLDNGYDGEFAPQLTNLLLRGALTALFLQSPTGEWPGAGRSAHHTWNDATLAATYEWAARQLAAREPELAGACKRGAQLALAAMQPFLRASGELSILRNHFEPEERHGFEAYSVHTTYNLWAAAALSIAYLFADDDLENAAGPISFQPLPSECSLYAIDLGAEFHQIAAANHGFFILIDGCGDPAANPTGLLRINRAGCNAQIGPSEGAVSAPRYSVLGQTGALAHAPAWKDRLGVWHSLAQYGSNRGSLSPTWRSNVVVEGDALQLTVTWRGALDGCQSIAATYHLTPKSVRIQYRLQGQITGLRAEIPLFAFDGEQHAEISSEGNLLYVRFRGSQEQVRLISQNAKLVLSSEELSTRTGLLRKAWAETSENVLEIAVDLNDGG